MKIKISEKLSWKNFFLASIGNAYTFNLKNHLVLKLKYPSIKDWRSINWRVWQKGPPPGSDRANNMLWKIFQGYSEKKSHCFKNSLKKSNFWSNLLLFSFCSAKEHTARPHGTRPYWTLTLLGHCFGIGPKKFEIHWFTLFYPNQVKIWQEIDLHHVWDFPSN